MDCVNHVCHTLRHETAFVKQYRYNALIDFGLLRKTFSSSIILFK